MLRKTALVMGGAAAPKPTTISGKAKYYTAMGWDACRHLYHGFRLLGKNTAVAYRLTRRLNAGMALTRKERILLERSTIDLLRLVPFSVFIIVPFGELLLPVALKMFPGLIPSTFETETQGKSKAFSSELVKMRARTKLQEYSTTQIVAVSFGYNDILRAVAHGDKLSVDHIKRVTPMFLTGEPLGYDKLPTEIVASLCKVTGSYRTYYDFVPGKWSKPYMVARLDKCVVKMKADDTLLQEEGLSMLTRDELEKANHARGMRWVDDDAALIAQLQDWIALSHDEAVPYHTLFFVKPTYHTLKQSMRSLPLDTRRKLLGIMTGTLPVHLADSMAELVEKVDKHDEAEFDASQATPEEIAGRAENTANIYMASMQELKNHDRDAVLKYFKARKIDDMYTELKATSKCGTGKVTVAATIDHLAAHAKVSRHVISTLFDALEVSDHTALLKRSSFTALLSRIKDEE
jgi:LETM1 and EF-hand domain-containing protein 1